MIEQKAYIIFNLFSFSVKNLNSYILLVDN